MPDRLASPPSFTPSALVSRNTLPDRLPGGGGGIHRRCLEAFLERAEADIGRTRRGGRHTGDDVDDNVQRRIGPVQKQVTDIVDAVERIRRGCQVCIRAADQGAVAGVDQFLDGEVGGLRDTVGREALLQRRDPLARNRRRHVIAEAERDGGAGRECVGRETIETECLVVADRRRVLGRQGAWLHEGEDGPDICLRTDHVRERKARGAVVCKTLRYRGHRKLPF